MSGTSAYSYQSRNTRKTWLLITLFVGLVSALFYLFGAVYGNSLFALFGLALSAGQALVAYFAGDKIALASVRAQKVEFEQAPQIHNLVENISKIADIPKPTIYISPDQSANAFACGRNPENASICINQGLIQLLNKSEIEGVIAHEIAHIKNRDILIMTVTMVLSSVVAFIADIGTRFALFGGLSRNRDDDSNSPIVFILYFIAILLAPLVSFLIQMAVSRSREYLADATAVTYTRYPNGLINALEKLYASKVPTQHYSTAMNHFYIAPPKKKFGEKVQSLFSTHPPISDRVTALHAMQGEHMVDKTN